VFPGVLVRGAFIALALLSAGRFAASADDGRPATPSGTGQPPTPSAVPLTELRPSEIRAAPVSTVAPDADLVIETMRAPERKKELVLFVGGYGSQVNDGAFDVLAAQFPSDRYDVRRLGDDPRFPYDTYGSVDANARVLTDEIRTVGASYSAVNVVSHSMGGVVTDRAFANGLSAADGVQTYVAIAGPHSGADYARAPAFVLPIVGPVKDIVRAPAVALARDPESQAVRDLATARPIRPPVGVARLDVSLATDGLVNEFDARNPGVPQRLFLPASPRELLDGHGGSLVNREIADLIVETVRTHEVPPDRRDPVTRLLAPIVWNRETQVWRNVLALLTLSALFLYTVRWIPYCRSAMDQLNAWCRRFIRSRGR
jgi:hypothetical protein